MSVNFAETRIGGGGSWMESDLSFGRKKESKDAKMTRMKEELAELRKKVRGQIDVINLYLDAGITKKVTPTMEKNINASTLNIRYDTIKVLKKIAALQALEQKD